MAKKTSCGGLKIDNETIVEANCFIIGDIYYGRKSCN